MAVGENYACCSGLNAHKKYCVNITGVCCDTINGIFVQDFACSGDQSGNGVDDTCDDFFCGNNILDPWEGCDDGNTVSGDGCSKDCIFEHGVCCEYDVDTLVECNEMESNTSCIATVPIPKLWIPNSSCSTVACPLQPPPEALCQCGAECCFPAASNVGLNLLFLILVLALIGLCCGCCFIFGFLPYRRDD